MKILVINCQRNITSDRNIGNPFKRQVHETYNVTYTLKDNIAYYIGEGDLSHQFEKIEVLKGSQANLALIQAQGVKP